MYSYSPTTDLPARCCQRPILRCQPDLSSSIATHSQYLRPQGSSVASAFPTYVTTSSGTTVAAVVHFAGNVRRSRILVPTSISRTVPRSAASKRTRAVCRRKSLLSIMLPPSSEAVVGGVVTVLAHLCRPHFLLT